MNDADLDRHIRAIIAREGGWVDDPDDSGGPTNRGITLGMWVKYQDAVFPGNSQLHAATDSEIMDFYRWYFRTQGLAELIDEFSIPDELVPLVMDLRTLHSPEGCQKILRGALARNGYSEYRRWVLVEDARSVGDHVALSRIRYMLEVAEERPKDRKFVRGWMHRALKAIGMWPPKPERREV